MMGVRRSIRVVALMEAQSITGPAKNLIEFSRMAACPPEDLPAVELTVATFQRGARENAFITGVKAAGLDVDVIRERRALDFGVLRQLRAVVSGRGPDILQTHNIKSHFLVRLAGLGSRYPWIAFQHGYTTTDTKMKLYNQLDRWSLPAANRVITVCKPFAAALAQRGVRPERIVVRHNMVTPFVPATAEEALRVRETLGIPGEALVVLCAGRLSREKGHADLIQAIAMLRRESGLPPFRLVLAGDGPERSRIERMCAELRVAGDVILAGHQAGLRAFYTMADMVALPSHSEGSPNVLLEAMAAGLPVAATAVGGVPEIAVNEQNALVVEAHVPQAMAAALARLLRDEALRKRLAASARDVVARHAPEAYCRSLIEVYQDVLEGARVATAFPWKVSAR